MKTILMIAAVILMHVGVEAARAQRACMSQGAGGMTATMTGSGIMTSSGITPPGATFSGYGSATVWQPWAYQQQLQNAYSQQCWQQQYLRQQQLIDAQQEQTRLDKIAVRRQRRLVEQEHRNAARSNVTARKIADAKLAASQNAHRSEER